MKHLIILIAITSIGFSGKSQVRTTEINGKTCYVYPYQQEVDYSKRLFRQGVQQEEKLHRDSLNREVVGSEITEIETPVPLDKGLKKSKKLFLRLRSEYPGVLMRYAVEEDKDITPALEPLPDGLYVQYYRDLPYVDKENILRYRNDVVAGMFHLKDNKLHGFACWMNAMGDTIKAGNFVNGLKEGEWFFNEYEIERFDNPYSKKPLVFEEYVKGTYTDTSFLKITYKNGLREGPTSEGYNDFVRRTGFYHNNEASGEWFEYGYTRKLVDKEYIYSSTPSIRTHYFIPEKPADGQKPVKSIIIRGRFIDRSRFDNIPETLILSNLGSFGEFYKLYIPENNTESDEGLELPEERNNSYPGEEYEEGIYNDYYVLDDESLESIDFEYDSPYRQYTFNGKEYSRNQLIDSLGYIANVANLYEEYYSNGQLKMRFRIVDGKIIEPDTIFWENSTPANVLTYNPLSKTYKEEVFDANHKSLYVNDYDSTGTLTTRIEENPSLFVHTINGKNYRKSDYSVFYELRGEDSLFHPISTRQTLYESLWPFDSTLAVSNTFDPATRILENNHYALNKDLVYQLSCEFGDGYDYVNATEICQSGKLMTKTIMSGSYDRGYRRYYFGDDEEDSLLTRRVYDWKDNYELTSDFILYYDNQPFSGKFTMVANAPDFNLSVSKNAIHLEYSTSDKHRKALKKAYNVYEKRRKVRKEARFMTMSTIYREEISSLVFNVLPFGRELFTPPNERFFRDFSSFNYEKRNAKPKTINEKDAEAFDKTIEGQFLDGKPSGTWTTRDQFGNPTTVMHFKNGELDGAVEHYKTVYPLDKKDFEYYEHMMQKQNALLQERYPEKQTHYLAKVYHYKNGVLNGPMYEMTWYGDTTVKANFVDGRREGDVLYRFKLGYSTAHFESGAPDGIARTYLTIPGRDTTLLFDLNYQNGLLQGESKSYHINGKLAKHGFFLTGQPIDDFEAFDTLGFRYQYVKFQYNQPVEEKIWEENQLSVRYEFDWRDSIEFNASAITETSSLEHLLYQMGAGEEARYQPYYGRPSSVDKTGINYTMTKYYPNDTIARHGSINAGKKTGCWEFYSYEGQKLYEVEYYDSIMKINDSVRFKSKGILTLLDAAGQPVCRSYIVEKVEKYDCSHTDHHEIRMLYTFWERDSSQHRINGYVKNYYDNGVLMNEGNMKDGLATGVWKFYDPYGNLNMVGEYILGKRNGRWLNGDLSQVKYMGDICLNPNLPNLEEIMSYQEKLLDISVIYYQMTKVIKREYYGVNMNPDGPPEGYEGEGEYEGEYYDDIEYYDR